MNREAKTMGESGSQEASPILLRVPRWIAGVVTYLFALSIFVIGGFSGACLYDLGKHILLSGFRSPKSEISQVPHYVPADNAIARFGLAPVNPDWVQVTHKSGQPIDGVPSHEWAVFTFAFEPKVEKIEQPNGATVWKVTFEP